jgi:tetratricopeptide (TPR) repeat protein
MVSWLFLGSWGFSEAAELAVLCLLIGGYLEILGHRRWRTLRDDAMALDRAQSLAAEGRDEEAITRLTQALRISPRLWQAYQYRGQLRTRRPETWQAALADFDEAIRLAPREGHLYALRSHVFSLLGDETSARQDSESAENLGGAAPGG